jgi:D-arabinose 1-dehydrogenase-like Zn-dependent alcohol dehydrogenase
MYDPLQHWKAGSDKCKRVGIVGGGGLGHMGVTLAKVRLQQQYLSLSTAF